MELADRVLPVPMRRVAVVSLVLRVREVLVVLAESGVVELAGPLGSGEGRALDALRRLESRQSAGARAHPSLARLAPDVDRLERSGARAVLAGEVEIERRRTSAVQHGSFAVFVGWAPKPAIEPLSARLETCGASARSGYAGLAANNRRHCSLRRRRPTRSGRCSAPTGQCRTATSIRPRSWPSRTA